MAKSKYSPALFEVMNRQKNTGTLGVPKWWKAGPDSEDGQPGEPPAGLNEPIEAGQPTPSVGAAGSLAAAPAPERRSSRASQPDSYATEEARYPLSEPASFDDRLGAGRLPGVRLDGNRLYLVLGPTHAAVICGVLLILLLASIQLGRSLGGSTPPQGADTSMTLLNQKPNPAVLDQPAGRADAPPARASAGPAAARKEVSGNAAAPPTEPPEELIVGMHYVLLDKYPRDAFKTAEFVQKWLAAEHGIPTVLRELKGSYWLIGKTGFDYSVPGEPEKCDQYVEKIKALGRDCRRELIRADLPVYGFASPMKFKLEK